MSFKKSIAGFDMKRKVLSIEDFKKIIRSRKDRYVLAQSRSKEVYTEGIIHLKSKSYDCRYLIKHFSNLKDATISKRTKKGLIKNCNHKSFWFYEITKEEYDKLFEKWKELVILEEL